MAMSCTAWSPVPPDYVATLGLIKVTARAGWRSAALPQPTSYDTVLKVARSRRGKACDPRGGGQAADTRSGRRIHGRERGPRGRTSRIQFQITVEVRVPSFEAEQELGTGNPDPIRSFV